MKLNQFTFPRLWMWQDDPAGALELSHIVGQSNDEKIRDSILNVAPTSAGEVRKRFHRYSISEIEGPPPDQIATARNRTTWKNGPVFDFEEFRREWHPNESWFLHDENGMRLWKTQGSGTDVRYFYLLNPGNPGVQQHYWQETARIHAAYGWTHAIIDNVGLDRLQIVLTLKKMGSKECREYPAGSDLKYQQDWSDFGAAGFTIMPKGFKRFCNAIGDWECEKILEDPFIDSWDGVLIENFGGWNGKYLAPDAQIRQLERVKRWTDAGKEVLCMVQLGDDPGDGQPDPEKGYKTALFAMIAGPLTSMRLVRNIKYGTKPLPLPEWVETIGDVDESEYKWSADGLISRRFKNAYLFTKDRSTWQETRTVEPQPDPIAVLTARIEALEKQATHWRADILELAARLDYFNLNIPTE